MDFFMDELALPVFQAFHADLDKSVVRPQWGMWVRRLENLCVTLKSVDTIVRYGNEPDQSLDNRIVIGNELCCCTSWVHKLLTFMGLKKGSLKLNTLQEIWF